MFGINLNFNLNRGGKARKSEVRAQLRGVCPHMNLWFPPDGSDDAAVESWFHSPVGTLNYVCIQCGFVAMGEQHVRVVLNSRMDEGPRALMDRQKRFTKIAKKAKLV